MPCPRVWNSRYQCILWSNNTPSATDVQVVGTPAEGETVQGEYTFVSPIPESGSTFQWFRADDASGTIDCSPP